MTAANIEKFELRLGTPLTIEQIETKNASLWGRFLHCENNLRNNYRAREIVIAAISLALVGTAMKLVCPSSFSFSDWPNLMASAFVELFGACWLSFLIAGVFDLFFDAHPSWAPLEKTRCDPMLHWLQGLPDGEAFRQAVIAQGREFTQAEAAMAERVHKKFTDWKKECAEKLALETKNRDNNSAKNAACRALYGMPDTDSTTFSDEARGS